MKRLILAFILCLLIFPVAGAVQTPPIQIAFTCNLAQAKCNEFLRLAANGLSCPAGTNAQRLACVQARTATRLTQIAREQKRAEDAIAAASAAESVFNADFPDEP